MATSGGHSGPGLAQNYGREKERPPEASGVRRGKQPTRRRAGGVLDEIYPAKINGY